MKLKWLLVICITIFFVLASQSAWATTTTRNATANTGAWTNPTYAYASDESRADGGEGATHDYTTYGFSIGSDAVDSVQVGLEYITDGNYYINVYVSCNGGGGWSSAYAAADADAETMIWINVTADATCSPWTATKLDNTNFQVRVENVRVGGPGLVVHVDWLPVEVLHVTPPSGIEWNETSLAFFVFQGDTDSGEANVTASGSNSDVNVTETSGNGTAFMDVNATTIGGLTNEDYAANLNCTPDIDQTPGYYESFYKVNSSENGTGNTLTVGCTVVNKTVWWNQSLLEIGDVEQAATGWSFSLVTSNGTNNDVNVTEIDGNGTGFMAENVTNIDAMTNGSTYEVNFSCSPSGGQAVGMYWSSYLVNSSEDNGTILNVTCNITPPSYCDISVNETYLGFGSLTPTETSETGTVDITNNGTETGNISIGGTDWTGPTTFEVNGTDFQGGDQASWTDLQTTDTQHYTDLASSSSFISSIRVIIPAGQQTGNYNQNVTYTVSC